MLLVLTQVEPVMKTDYEDVWDWRVENDNKPLWTRSPKEVSEADYNDFFKQVWWASIPVLVTPTLVLLQPAHSWHV
jgi:HSP90 family molecular chaperone